MIVKIFQQLLEGERRNYFEIVQRGGQGVMRLEPNYSLIKKILIDKILHPDYREFPLEISDLVI
jgi:hypothetical protein